MIENHAKTIRTRSLLLLSIFIFLNCNQKHENTSIDKSLVVTLEKVTSNCRLDSDVSPPVPKLFFYLKFENKSDSSIFIELNNILERDKNDVTFTVVADVDGKKVKLPLYKNTSRDIYLEGNTVEVHSAVTYFRDIESVYRDQESKDMCFFLEELLNKKLSFSYLNTSLTVSVVQRSQKHYHKIGSFDSDASNFKYERSTSDAIE